jgi:hypothetical protein
MKINKRMLSDMRSVNIMALSKAATGDEYLDGLTPDLRQTISALRQVVLDNLQDGYLEAMQHGMIGYVISLEKYPITYNGQALEHKALASQKNYKVPVPDERLRQQRD